MLKLKTAKGFEIPITWIGISDFDGSLRFETTERNMEELFRIFNDPEHTRCLMRLAGTLKDIRSSKGWN